MTVMQACQVLVFMVPNDPNGIFDVDIVSVGKFCAAERRSAMVPGAACASLLNSTSRTTKAREITLRSLHQMHYCSDRMSFPHPPRLDLGSTARMEKHVTRALRRFTSMNERLRAKAHVFSSP